MMKTKKRGMLVAFSLLMSMCILFCGTNFIKAAEPTTTVNFTNSYNIPPDPNEAAWAVYVDSTINLNLSTPSALSSIQLVGANNIPLTAYTHLMVDVQVKSESGYELKFPGNTSLATYSMTYSGGTLSSNTLFDKNHGGNTMNNIASGYELTRDQPTMTGQATVVDKGEAPLQNNRATTYTDKLTYLFKSDGLTAI